MASSAASIGGHVLSFEPPKDISFYRRQPSAWAEAKTNSFLLRRFCLKCENRVCFSHQKKLCSVVPLCHCLYLEGIFVKHGGSFQSTRVGSQITI